MRDGCPNCGRRAGQEPCDWIECDAHSKARLYIAGPMTGLDQLNFPAFHAKAAEHRALGYVVVNPAEINNEDPADALTMSPEELAAHWRKCMRADLTALLTCDGVVMLDGWTASKGATLEHHVARALGMTVIYPE